MTSDERLQALHHHIAAARKEAADALDAACIYGSDEDLERLYRARDRLAALERLTLEAMLPRA